MAPDGDIVNGYVFQSRASEALLSSSSKASSSGSDAGPAMIDVRRQQHRMRGPFSSSSKASSPGSDAGPAAPPASDEDGPCPPAATNIDHHHVDRRQRRMLSNRESARRSRLRKQQHLDELRALVAQLQAQNTQMLSSFNLASHRFSQIAEENRVLQSEALDLGHRLQLLHHALNLQPPDHPFYDGKHDLSYDSHPGLPELQYLSPLH